MIDLAKILDRLDAEMTKKGLTAAEVSRAATGSPDTIRNWRRATGASSDDDTQGAKATIAKLNQIEKAIGVELAVNAPVPIEPGQALKGEDEVKAMLRRIEGFPPGAIDPAWRFIMAFIGDAASPPQDQPRDRSERATPHREAATSR